MLAYHTTRNQAEKVKAEHEWQLLGKKKPNRFLLDTSRSRFKHGEMLSRRKYGQRRQVQRLLRRFSPSHTRMQHRRQSGTFFFAGGCK